MKTTYGWLAVIVVGMGAIWGLGRDDRSSGKFVGEFNRTLARLSDDLPAIPDSGSRRPVAFNPEELKQFEDLIANCCVRKFASARESNEISASLEPDCGGWNE
jgi:hypothetical protein